MKAGFLLVLQIFLSALETHTVTPRLCEETATAARSHLEGHGVLATLSGARVTIVPGEASRLNAYAAWARGAAGSAVVYDPGFFAAHPWAAASFDRGTNTLFLPHAAIVDATPDEHGVLHESVHLRTFADLLARRQSPYYGKLHGEPFAPADLELDEMNAYSHDLELAGRELHAGGVTTEAAAVARLAEILDRREAGEGPVSGLTPLEERWDFLVKKLVHARWHTEPVPAALSELLRAAPKKIRFTAHSHLVTAEISAAKFTGFFPLVDSPSAGDSENPGRTRRELERAARSAASHGTQLAVVRELARAAAGEADARLRRALVAAFVSITPRPAPPTDGAALRKLYREAVERELHNPLVP